MQNSPRVPRSLHTARSTPQPPQHKIRQRSSRISASRTTTAFPFRSGFATPAAVLCVLLPAWQRKPRPPRPLGHALSIAHDSVPHDTVWTRPGKSDALACFRPCAAAVHPLQVRLGETLRRRREAAGLSQESLAAQAELHRNYVGLLERGRVMPSLLVVQKLATALGSSMVDLVTEVEQAGSHGRRPLRPLKSE